MLKVPEIEPGRATCQANTLIAILPINWSDPKLNFLNLKILL